MPNNLIYFGFHLAISKRTCPIACTLSMRSDFDSCSLRQLTACDVRLNLLPLYIESDHPCVHHRLNTRRTLRGRFDKSSEPGAGDHPLPVLFPSTFSRHGRNENSGFNRVSRIVLFLET